VNHGNDSSPRHDRREWLRCASAALCAGVAPGILAMSPAAVTVPMATAGDRPVVRLRVAGAAGRTVEADFLVDSGGGHFLLTEALASTLGLVLGEIYEEDGARFSSARPVSAALGGLVLELDPDRTSVLIGSSNILPQASGTHADGMLPGHVLSRYRAVFDYPAARFTLGQGPSVAADGVSLEMPVHPRSGFPWTEIEVDGERFGMLLDTGASFTMVSHTLLTRWAARHPQWTRFEGANGAAATLGGRGLNTLYLPRMQWGPLALDDVGVVSQPAGTFEKWITSMTARPVVGALAGNILTRFRLGLHYDRQVLHAHLAAGTAGIRR
jgi:hypothetical protein